MVVVQNCEVGTTARSFLVPRSRMHEALGHNRVAFRPREKCHVLPVTNRNNRS
jgi:hypothetical protein